jgi:hypothetical protein
VLEPHAGDLAQQQGPQVVCGDASGKTVAAGFDPQRRSSRDEHTDRMVVHQRLHLRRPSIEILHLVEKQKRRLAAMCRLVERMAQNLLLEPARDCEDRFLQPALGRQLVEGDVQYAARIDSLMQQRLDDLP